MRCAEDVGGRPARSAARMFPDHVGPARAVQLSFIIILLEMVPDRRVKNHNATCREVVVPSSLCAIHDASSTGGALPCSRATAGISEDFLRLMGETARAGECSRRV